MYLENDNYLPHVQAPAPGLVKFIGNSQRNRIFLTSAMVAIVGLLLVFKHLYPYPNLVLDSYYYIKAAVLHQSINAWPIGYSVFIRFFGLFSHSAYLFVCTQYILLEFACLFLFFSWQYLFKPGVVISCVLFVFLFFNPILLYCCNYILADGLFITCSILWFTQLLWIIYRPKPYMIFTHALLLLTVFSVRYNALYYPVVTILAFIFSRYQIRLKLIGILIPILLIGGFIVFSSSRVMTITGQPQFSPFGGWKLLNDALYGYAYVPKEKIEAVPEKYKALDTKVRSYFQSKSEQWDLLKNDSAAGSFYMFQETSPLLQYMDSLYGPGRPFLNTKKWMAVAPLYQSYGAYLIRQYPRSFARYFLWPNLQRYIFPPAELFGSTSPFYIFESFGAEYPRQFFGLTALETKQEHIDLSIKIASPFSLIFTFFHITFLFGFFAFLFTGAFQKQPKSHAFSFILVFGLWLIDLGFGVFAAGIVLRYEIFVMIVEISFGLYFIEQTYKHLGDSPAPPQLQPSGS